MSPLHSWGRGVYLQQGDEEEHFKCAHLSICISVSSCPRVTRCCLTGTAEEQLNGWEKHPTEWRAGGTTHATLWQWGDRAAVARLRGMGRCLTFPTLSQLWLWVSCRSLKYRVEIQAVALPSHPLSLGMVPVAAQLALEGEQSPSTAVPPPSAELLKSS